MNLSVRRRDLALRAPLVTAWGSLSVRTILEVGLDGGRGEAAPLEPYDGVPLRAVEEALVACAEVLREFEDGTPGAAVLEACRTVTALSEALAAIDLALWDRVGVPVCEALSDAPAASVRVNALGVRDGFDCVKVKVGLPDDVARVAAIRGRVGPDVLLRLDANGAWTVDEALERLAALAPYDIEFCEEPVHGTDALRAVAAASPIPIAQDETETLCAPIVCLKVGRCGGISGLLARASLARAQGREVYLASALDGPAGIAAALHCAAALRIERHCGLATLDLFEGPPALPSAGGVMVVPPGPGLGTFAR